MKRHVQQRGLPPGCKTVGGSAGIACPECGKQRTAVIDLAHYPAYTRRRRTCLECGRRFTSRETVVTKTLWSETV